MYKPNFCAECGARVERPRWRAWTSRRFCPACARRFRRARFVRPAVAALALLALGFAAGRALRPAPPPLVIERGRFAPGAQSAFATSGDTNNAPSPTAPRYAPEGGDAERPTDPDELVYLCGARTKKGTPCQRRVRGEPARCWQHRGKAAMLRPEKLLVRE